MKDTLELRQEKTEAIDKMKALLDKADDEHRDMTIAEKSEYNSLDRKVDAIAEKIKQHEKVGRLDEERNRVTNPLSSFMVDRGKTASKGTSEARGGFENIGEMIYAMDQMKRNNKPDDRLMSLLVEHREQQMGTGQTGGFAVPEQFRDELLLAVAQTGIVRPRATVIPAGSPPDAKLSIPALDQTSGANMYGGVTLVHTGEGVTMTETTAKLKEISFEPKEISAYLTVTNKLLNNWVAASEVLGNLLRGAMIGAEDYDFLRGDGVNKALGIINSPASINYARNTPNSVVWSDIYNMAARLKMGGNPIWIASQTIIPSLAAMQDSGSHAVFIGGSNLSGSAAGGLPSTLFGFPIVFSDRLPTLGTKGDLILADLAYYVIKDGSGPFLAWSEHVYWTANKSVVKIVWNVDGKAWLTEPLILEGTTASTVSPFVVLT